MALIAQFALLMGSTVVIGAVLAYGWKGVKSLMKTGV